MGGVRVAYGGGGGLLLGVGEVYKKWKGRQVKFTELVLEGRTYKYNLYLYNFSTLLHSFCLTLSLLK